MVEVGLNADVLFRAVVGDTVADNDMVTHIQVAALVVSQMPQTGVPFERCADLITKHNKLNVNKFSMVAMSKVLTTFVTWWKHT